MTNVLDDWTPDGQLMSEVEAQFERAIASYVANPNLIVEHANHEESIRVGGYANRTLLELVQNAADAMSGVSEGGRVEIVLDTQRGLLYCANEGRPFSKQGIVAIEHAHLSGKRGDEIGRFGLGFKSVLAVSGQPQVFSRSVSFEFNSEQARAAISSVRPGLPRLPILRTATLIDANRAMSEDPVLNELGEWATTVVRLPGLTNIPRLQQDIEDFASEFLLFVTSVRSISLRVLGDDGFTVSHMSRSLGEGVFRIERPNGEGSEWLVVDRMHKPSAAARHEVGEAVSRDEVKVTVAVPSNHSDRRVGEFWSYFPLQDRTTATGLFNAPWSVNDDRTTLLRNQYNTEILETMAEMLLEIFPLLSNSSDPARHFDYMPARGRESRSFGDDILCDRVPRYAKGNALIPDARGVLRTTIDLLPVSFDAPIADSVHRAWSEASHTPDDVPHWRCYTSPQRVARLRQVMLGEYRDPADLQSRSAERDAEVIPQRGLLTWLTLWAAGDSESAANALRFVRGNSNLSDIDNARVIPTTAGLRAVKDRNRVFLRQEEGIGFEDAAFVDPAFLSEPGIEQLLRSFGFSVLDPSSILGARLAALSAKSEESEFVAFWDAALDVSERDAVRVVQKGRTENTASIKVPTLDGGWHWPSQVLDLDVRLDEAHSHLALDRSRCVPPLARHLGTVTAPEEDYSLEDEILEDSYLEAVKKGLNDRRGPGERPIERIEVYPPGGAVAVGPFSALILLEKANAPEHLRVEWTYRLMESDAGYWDCEDLDTRVTHRVMSPARWAVNEAGLVFTALGARRPQDAVAPSLVSYRELLPLFEGPRHVAERLDLPSEIQEVPAELLGKALATERLVEPMTDQALTDFVTQACNRAYGDSQAPVILARVGRVVESRPTNSVFIATTDEQQAYLATRHRPFLRVSEDGDVADSLAMIGCRRFDDAFSFSVIVEGSQGDERLLDVFPGLRSTLNASELTDVSIQRAGSITKRVNREDGVEDEFVPWHLDGHSLILSDELDTAAELRAVNEAFGLSLSNQDLQQVLDAGIALELELMRTGAQAAVADVEKLESYFGDDDLREGLPKGLWEALVRQGLVDEGTSVADLFLTVYRTDAIKQLANNFRELGFNDVPTQWAGKPATVTWLRKMGFGSEYGGRRSERRDPEFVVPGATILSPLHDFQNDIRLQLNEILTTTDERGRSKKVMVELPTGAGKTRVASETVLKLFIDGELTGPVLWIAQSQELCEQAVQTWSTVWRGLRDERPLAVARLWENNEVHEPDTEFSLVVATDMKLKSIIDRDDDTYAWLSEASVVIIDEGHRAGESQMYTGILQWLGIAGHGFERPLVGLSATPFKGGAESTRALANRFGDRKIKAFEDNAYEELVQLGVLAKVSHRVLQGVDFHLTAEQEDEATRMRRISPEVLGRIGADHRRNMVLTQDILSLDPDWPVLVFTPSVLSAQVLAATLRIRGVDSAAVSGQTGRQERRDVIESFKNGEIRVLTNCDLLIQGFDAPGVRALYIARPTFSPSAYIQMAGRGLRGSANGGKEECLIVDMADNFQTASINSLLGFHEYEGLWGRQDS